MSTIFDTAIDNLSTTVGAPFFAGGTSITVAAGDGALFGTVSPTSPVRIVVVQAAGLSPEGLVADPTKLTVFRATGRSGDTLTGLTVVEGQSALHFTTGDAVVVCLTAGMLSAVQVAVNVAETKQATDESAIAALQALESSTVYTTGSYANPAWITALAGSKVTGNIPGSAAGLTASIPESQVTNLSADLANLQIGKLSAAANLADVGDPALSRANLGVAVGANVQAWDPDLDALGSLAHAKGNLIASGTASWVNVTIGGDGQVLTADSTQSAGVKWAAAGASGANALGSYVVQAATNAPANAQILAALATGLLKTTTATGVLSVAAAGTDYLAPAGSGAALTGVVHTVGVESIAGAKTFTDPATTFGDGTGQPTVSISGAAGQVRDLAYRTAGVMRWMVRVENTAEGGSNTGSNFVINARADGGTSLGDWLAINRATGLVTIGAATIAQSGVCTGTWQGTAIGTTYGGTGLDSHLAGNGALLIGNGGGFSLATLTAGTNVTITPGAGSITIAATGGGGTPGGSSGQVQFNNSSAFGGAAGLVYSATATTLQIQGQTLGFPVETILEAPLSTFAITNVGLTGNVATITTAAPHGINQNQQLIITNCSVSGAVFDGVYTAINPTSSTTITFNKTNANISSTAATGSVYGARGRNTRALFDNASSQIAVMTAAADEQRNGSSYIVNSIQTPGGVSVTLQSSSGGTLGTTARGYQLTVLDWSGRESAASAVVNFTPSSGSTNQIRVSWQRVEGAAAYRVYGGATGSALYQATVVPTAFAGTYQWVDTGAITGVGAPPSTTLANPAFIVIAPTNAQTSTPSPAFLVQNPGGGILTAIDAAGGIQMNAAASSISMGGGAANLFIGGNTLFTANGIRCLSGGNFGVSGGGAGAFAAATMFDQAASSNAYTAGVMGGKTTSVAFAVRHIASNTADVARLENPGGTSVLMGWDAKGRPYTATSTTPVNTPTIVAGSGAGTGATVAVQGTDINGQVVITTGSSAVTPSAVVATITYSSGYGVAPKMLQLTPANSAAAMLTGAANVWPDASSLTTTTWALSVGSTPLAATTTYRWYYNIVG